MNYFNSVYIHNICIIIHYYLNIQNINTIKNIMNIIIIKNSLKNHTIKKHTKHICFKNNKNILKSYVLENGFITSITAPV